MELTIKGDTKEIAALVLAIQKQQSDNKTLSGMSIEGEDHRELHMNIWRKIDNLEAAVYFLRQANYRDADTFIEKFSNS